MSTQPDPDETRIRLRALLDAQFTLLVIVCVVLAAAGGVLVYGTYVDPGTETESQEVSSWSYDAGYDHSAEVTEPNEVFPVGTVLEDRETYFTRIAPELDVAAELVYAAEQSEDVRVDIESERRRWRGVLGGDRAARTSQRGGPRARRGRRGRVHAQQLRDRRAGDVDRGGSGRVSGADRRHRLHRVRTGGPA
ncbi:hypothetical protein J2751_002548 [Halorubrum alkaliphilum]|uniref:Uncharacterized protein n=1 Tax=Halorubrum alkaliphilum TaxID=261290 RepID=A0A8T4GH15_9EURY|nr:hypothetical protein [Halorubrum alkaliphilum]